MTWQALYRATHALRDIVQALERLCSTRQLRGLQVPNIALARQWFSFAVPVFFLLGGQGSNVGLLLSFVIDRA